MSLHRIRHVLTKFDFYSVFYTGEVVFGLVRYGERMEACLIPVLRIAVRDIGHNEAENN